MGIRPLNILLSFLAFILMNDTLGQCFVTRFKMKYKDSCKYMNVYARYEKALEVTSQIKNISVLFIFNRKKPLVLPESLLNMQLYSISMDNCRNDSIFLKMHDLHDLSYFADSLNKNLIYKCDLVNFSVRFKHGNLDKLSIDSNDVLRRLSLVSNNECKLDTTLGLFIRLSSINFCFNPFLDENYVIFSRLNNLKEIGVSNMDFRKITITIEMLERLVKYSVSFKNCKFNVEQRKMLENYKNIHFW